VTKQRPTSFWLVWGAVVVLGILHQDVWFWGDRTLLMGFLPIGLAYHALFSVAAACLWFAATRFAWPVHLEEWADEFENDGPESSAGSESAT
jgi:hypothetical protein